MEQDSITINKSYSLQELMLSVQSVLQKTYSNKYFWIRCEVARISLHVQSGHCYLELIEKNEKAIVAQMKGIIWSDKYNFIVEKFHRITNSHLANGMKVLLSCGVTFHPLHGLSLTIVDVEPSFTLGEMARMKNDSIARLKTEGLFNLNRNTSLPALPYRIAIISVETSRGYHDFISTIINHKRKYAISHTLFEAILQGENAVLSLSHAIKKILSQKDLFDAIAIIRGGAGDAGLACYDEYSLSSIIARSTLPVITGIGHATNVTVAEMIAFKNCITPTAAAGFILEKFDVQASILDEKVNSFIKITATHFADSKTDLVSKTERLVLFIRNKMSVYDLKFKNIYSGLPAGIKRYFAIKSHDTNSSRHSLLNVKRFGIFSILSASLQRSRLQIENLAQQKFTLNKSIVEIQIQKMSVLKSGISSKSESLLLLSEKIKLLDPVNILNRGYSITRSRGIAVVDAKTLAAGTTIETQLANGTIISIVENK